MECKQTSLKYIMQQQYLMDFTLVMTTTELPTYAQVI